jgi:hypothetical protein
MSPPPLLPGWRGGRGGLWIKELAGRDEVLASANTLLMFNLWAKDLHMADRISKVCMCTYWQEEARQPTANISSTHISFRSKEETCLYFGLQPPPTLR